MKKGQLVFGFKKYGNFILDQEIENLKELSLELQWSAFICYDGVITPTGIVLSFDFATIIEGIENGLFWTCSMENVEKSLTFMEKYFTKIVIGFLIISITIAYAVML